MVKQSNSSNKNEIRALLGDEVVDSWNEEKVSQWLEEKGWGHFASTFKKYHIYQDRFFEITLAELVQYLPRTMTTYYERRRLLNEIRSLIPSSAGKQQKPAPSTPTNISINTNFNEYTRLGDHVNNNRGLRVEQSSRSPVSASSGSNVLFPLNSNSSDNADYLTTTTTRDSGFGHIPYYSAGSSSPSPSPSPSSEYLTTTTTATGAPLFTRKHTHNTSSPTRSSYSPKAAFLKIKNTFRSHTSSSSSPQQSLGTITSSHNYQHHHASQQNSASSLHDPAVSPRSSRHESGDEDRLGKKASPSPIIPARVSSTPDKISKFWANYSSWHSSASPTQASTPTNPTAASYNAANNNNSSSSSKKSAGCSPSSFISHSDYYNQQQKKKEQRVQVTADEETWYSLIVTDMRDPVVIKLHILNRLNFTGNYKHYMFFHENGSNPDTPMEPHELMYLCSIADHSASHRILVKPIVNAMFIQKYMHFFQTPYFNSQQGNKPELGMSPTSDTSSSQSYSQLPTRPSLLNRKPQKRIENDDALNRIVGIQLSDPPQTAYYSPRQRTGSEPHITPPPSQALWRHSEPDMEKIMENGSNELHPSTVPIGGLWAVPPQSPSSSSSPTRSAASSSSPPPPPPPPLPPLLPSSLLPQLSKKQQLWAVIPHTNTRQPQSKPNPPSPISPNYTQLPPFPSPHPPPPLPPKSPSRAKVSPLKTKESEFWGERPPAEVVFQHMEQYFDRQALDKEVLVPISTTVEEEANDAIKQPSVLRRPTHTKSIRLVAREASQKYSRMAKNDTAVKGEDEKDKSSVPTPPLMVPVRRKSTKLWGQRVVELKTRSKNVIARLPSVSEHMSLLPEQQPEDDVGQKDTAVQWIRGKLIGKGSFGRVYLAFNVGTGEVIAVKQVEIPKTTSDLLNESQHNMVEALYQEIMMLRDLDHENIVQYLGYGRDEGVINIFLEYISGGSIASRLALQGAFDEPLTKYFTRQICAGLEYLHSKHILHRDIKAANILVEVDGICKISDFGLSKKNDYDEVYDQNSRMSLRGTIYWMAPEVVKNEPYSAKVDIWSLGCTVIEMLTGQRPWISLNQIAALYNLGRLQTPTIPENISDCAKDFLRQCFIM
ncbi:MAG: hypothetical protein EXX96DRAFT_553495 [Benjaminiella poitrasii]|nr:MAG: hypothetical protein EXX96DRAFT_553495 [Benjaminiella poitrasii]